jgi:hypothetical protein
MDTNQSKIQNLEPKIYGDFDENLPPSQEYLRIQFSPSSVPIKQQWRNNGLSANFMADFLLTFFPSKSGAISTEEQKIEIQGVICYVANELLENAMKFTDENTQEPISLTLYLLSDSSGERLRQRLVFLSTNSTSIQSKEKLQQFIQRLTPSNLNQLYAEQLEKSALDESNSSAGLGILTMMNDYLAKVGWKLEEIQHQPEIISVTTMVQLVI